MSVNLETEDFNDFVRCLTNLKEVCNDVNIQNGFIRQRTNDKITIFEMDMTDILEDLTMPISNLKKKMDLLKTFVGHDVLIEVVEGESEEESYFTFTDELTSIQVKFPFLEFMDNKFIEEDELEKIHDANEEDLIIDIDLDKISTDRIRIITDNFNTEALQVHFINDEAFISSVTQSGDLFAKFKKDIPMNMDFEGNYLSNLSIVPFIIEHDDELNMKMYHDVESQCSLNKITTELGTSGIKINMYCRSSIIEESE